MPLDPPVVVAMLGVGLVMGFIGIGGAGVAVAVLVALFGTPIHLAFGTALGAMSFSSLTGAWSHLRAGNVELDTGLQIGLAGVLGAWLGGGLALATGAANLKVLSGAVLIAASGMLYLRTRVKPGRGADRPPVLSWRGLPASCGIGLACGLSSGYLSIGMAPWVQVALLTARRMDVRRAIGTGMLVMSLVGLSGALRYAQGGQQDLRLLTSVVLGLSVGAYVGARFTARAPLWLLRVAIVGVPTVSGLVLITSGTTA